MIWGNWDSLKKINPEILKILISGIDRIGGSKPQNIRFEI